MAPKTAPGPSRVNLMRLCSASFTGTIPADIPRAVRPVAVADRASGPRPKVLHFIPGIGGGGAEAMLLNLTESMHGGDWRTVVVAVDARSRPAEAARLRRVTESFYDLQSPVLLKAQLLRRFTNILRAEKPDIVQTWMHHADLVGGLWARMAGVRNIVWAIHCREIHRNPGDGDWKMSAFRAALAACSRLVPRRIVSCSAAAIEDHAGRGYPQRKMLWIPNGVCPQKFAPRACHGAALRAELQIPDAVPVVGFAGRFHEMKKLDTFLRAAALLQRSIPDVRFILCGGSVDDLDSASRAAWEDLPHKDRVLFMPFRQDMERFYPALSLFSLSSRTEACPMTLLEAMACGVPCAATDAGDCAALLGHASLIAPPGDPAALACVWQKALGADASAIGRELRVRVLEHYTITRTASLYQSTYAGLIPARS